MHIYTGSTATWLCNCTYNPLLGLCMPTLIGFRSGLTNNFLVAVLPGATTNIDDCLTTYLRPDRFSDGEAGAGGHEPTVANFTLDEVLRTHTVHEQSRITADILNSISHKDRTVSTTKTYVLQLYIHTFSIHPC